jgi:formiminotetrahydrofolate cyclodeaminase
MGCNLTVGKKKYQNVAVELTGVREKAQQLQKRLYELVAEDSHAYANVMTAFELPKTTDEEKTKRGVAIQDALKCAVNTPLEAMKNALEVLKLTKLPAEKGNPNTITDIGCAVHLAKAAIAGTALNVRINLSSINDSEFTTQTAKEILQIQQTGDEISRKVLELVESKI